MKITAVQSDITSCQVDVIVNAAGPSLGFAKSLGGLDQVIHRAAGKDLLLALQKLGTCGVGEVVVTPGFALPAKWIIHAVAPKWRGGTHKEATFLGSCYQSILRAAKEVGAKTIAIPALGTGAYRFPSKYAAEIAVGTLAAEKECEDMEVTLVAYDEKTLGLYQKNLRALKENNL